MFFLGTQSSVVQATAALTQLSTHMEETQLPSQWRKQRGGLLQDLAILGLPLVKHN